MKLILAYIDPASGSIIFQLILATVLGFLVYLKKIKLFILGFLNRFKRN